MTNSDKELITGGEIKFDSLIYNKKASIIMAIQHGYNN